MGEQHSPAAVSFNPKIIKDLTCVLGLGSFLKFIPYAGNDFTA
jgi:hypothetical protein